MISKLLGTDAIVLNFNLEETFSSTNNILMVIAFDNQQVFDATNLQMVAELTEEAWTSPKPLRVMYRSFLGVVDVFQRDGPAIKVLVATEENGRSYIF